MGMVLGAEWQKPSAVLRKALKIFTHPIGAAQSAGYYANQWRSRRRIVDAGLEHELTRAEAKCRETGALAPCYFDLWFLYANVRTRKPQVVFEFGSGLSTNFIAAALKANGLGKLYSFEDQEEWFRAASEWLPEHARPYVEIIYSPVRVEAWGDTPVFHYSNIPDVTPDMVYLDGPTLTPTVRAAADVLFMESGLKPGFLLVVDGRWDNVAFLDRHLKREYKREQIIGFLGNDALLTHTYELVG